MRTCIARGDGISLRSSIGFPGWLNHRPGWICRAREQNVDSHVMSCLHRSGQRSRFPANTSVGEVVRPTANREGHAGFTLLHMQFHHDMSASLEATMIVLIYFWRLKVQRGLTLTSVPACRPSQSVWATPSRASNHGITT